MSSEPPANGPDEANGRPAAESPSPSDGRPGTTTPEPGPPASSAPAGSARTGAAPATGVPASSVPASSVPAGGAPAGGAPAGGVPAGGAPAGGGPAGAAPTGGVPAGGVARRRTVGGRVRRILPVGRVAWALAVAYLVDGVGTGLWLATSVLYLTRSAGLTAAQVGVGLSIGGLAGLVATVPLGRFADRRGLRGVCVGLTLAQAGLMAGYAAVSGMAVFVLVTVLFTVAQRAGNAIRNALLGAAVGPDARLRVRAYCRSAANVGLSLGALAAAPVLAADGRAGYLAAVLANAGSFLLVAAALASLPAVAVSSRRRSGLGALTDRRYVTMTALTGLLALHKPVLTVAVPLWVAGHTAAPRSAIAALLVINTGLTVLLQVPLSRRAGNRRGAVRVLRASGVALAVSCLLLAAAAGRSAPVALALLVAGVAVLTIGELWQSAGGWELSYDLAPDDAQGEYQAAYSMLNGVRDSVGPLLVTAALINGGTPGWLALAAGFVAIGMLLGPAIGVGRGRSGS